MADSKESACNAENLDSIPELGSFPGEGNGYPLQYSCLENSTGEAGGLQPMGVAESDMTEQLKLSSHILNVNLVYFGF